MLNKFKIIPICLLGVNAESDCRQIIGSLYPAAGVCNREMICSSDFACYFDEEKLAEDPCNAYDCLMESRCPPGTTYLPYYPALSGDSTGTGSSSAQAGYACYPNDKLPEHSFQCNFDSTDNYRLSINVMVPDITRHYNWDYRNMTLINWDNYQLYPEDNVAMVDLFQSSECVGEVNDEKVYFNDIKNGAGGCSFTNLGMEVDEDGVPFYTQKFVVGYDDLVDTMTGGGIVVKRFGKNYIVNCRIRAWDTLWVDPGAEGEREDPEFIADTQVGFELKMYSDPQFETPVEGLVNLGKDETVEDTTIYVEAKANIDGSTGDFLIHLKRCNVGVTVRDIIDLENEQFGDWKMTDNEYDFLIDGMLTTDQFTTRNMEIKDKRVEWSDESTRTYTIDQFKVDLWQAAEIEKGKQQSQLRITCEMVACELAAFDSDAENAICTVADGVTRYNNLLSPVRSARRSYGGSKITGEKPKRSEMTKEETAVIFNSSIEITVSTLFIVILTVLYV